MRTAGYIIGLALSILAVQADGKGIARDTLGVGLVSVSHRLQETSSALRTHDSRTLPEFFYVCQNYPNPFNANTVVAFDLSEESGVHAMIYNVLGSRIRTLENDIKEAGRYELVWDGRSDQGETVSSGVYFFVLVAESNYSIKKMMFVK